MITDSNTKLVALIGHPIFHTKSPELFSHFEEAFAPNAVYVPFDVDPEQLTTAIKGLKALGFVGANITAPYKNVVFKKAKTLGIKLTDVAKHCQSVNCLYFENGELWGTTTDYVAMYDLLMNSVDPYSVSSVGIIGCGGMATVILQACWRFGAFGGKWASFRFGSVDFICRDVMKATEIINPMYDKMTRRGKIIPDPNRPKVFQLTDQSDEIFWKYDVLINATPVGMYPNVDASPIPDNAALGLRHEQTLIDLIYNPKETKFLSQGNEHGCKCVNGQALLVDQFVESFRLWFPKETSGCSKEELIDFGLKEL